MRIFKGQKNKGIEVVSYRYSTNLIFTKFETEYIPIKNKIRIISKY